jgi:hypothetical protein
MSKYNAIATVVDGFRFASKKEAAAYSDLKYRQMAGEIGKLELQPKYPIIVNGVKICDYIGDFRFVDYRTNETIVMDVKGVKTPVYRLKAKLMLACYGIEILET